VDLDESITVATPEGLELRLALAGLGSRFIAGVTDLLIQSLLIGILGLVTQALSGSGGVPLAVYAIGAFLVTFFYPVAFEVLHAGRTPGKQWSHLRVVRDSGAPVDLQASAIRNLMRLVDGPTLLYLPTVVFIAVTKRNQRPGDLAAGTLVIREPAGRSAASDPPREGAIADGRWDASAVTEQETAAVRRFLERRDSLDEHARRQLARRLAEGLRLKVTAAPADLSPERFLEELVRRK
jgi:uncharacterized RDD family membrane protein YckC